MSGATISTTAALLISAGVAAAGTASEMIYSAVSKPSMPTAPSQAKTAQEQAQASQAAALAQAQALTQRRGMAATQLTSPMGTSGTADIQKSTLGA